ncbi:hypothetical protein ACVGW2_00055, partial [Enterobacter intestinihominis]
PYPYRRRRRRGDLTFLPGGGGVNPPKKTIARPCNPSPPRRFNKIIRAEKIVKNFLFFKPHV